MSKRIIAVDFDGVVHSYKSGWSDVGRLDPPVEGAAQGLKKLIDKGYEVVIFTARPTDHYLKIRKWLERHKFPFVRITNVKPAAIAYIDDRGIRFTSWRDMLNYF